MCIRDRSKTLDPKVGSNTVAEEILIIEGDLPKDKIAEVQGTSGKVVTALENENGVSPDANQPVTKEIITAVAAVEEPKGEKSTPVKSDEKKGQAPSPTVADTTNTPAKKQPPVNSASTPAKHEEKKKKKGLFSKLKKIFK